MIPHIENIFRGSSYFRITFVIVYIHCTNMSTPLSPQLIRCLPRGSTKRLTTLTFSETRMLLGATTISKGSAVNLRLRAEAGVACLTASLPCRRSQIALEFAYQVMRLEPHTSAFWVEQRRAVLRVVPSDWRQKPGSSRATTPQSGHCTGGRQWA
jgi:hypothetical protein